jgi:gliding motility-associated-like protein
MKKYFTKKSIGLILSLFVFYNFSNAQEGRLPTQAELNTKMNLEALYSSDAYKATHHGKQLMSSAPEQDCANAVSVCQQSYTQANSYSGIGANQELSGTCLSGGETNSVWYTFTVQNPGTFTFTLNVNNTDDYDFALYNITSIGCAGVPSATPVRCNYSATTGPTGLTLPASSSSTLSVGSSGSSTMPGVNVTTGQTFALIINNFTANTNGYSVAFGGTAQIFDNTPPSFGAATRPCNSSFVNLAFSEPVQCTGILTNGTNFTIAGPGGINVPVTSASGNLCSTGAAVTSMATINFNSAGLPTGTYTINLAANTISDNCGNAMANGQSTTFNYFAPITLTLDNPVVCYGDSATINLTGANGASGVTYSWAPTSGTYDSIVVKPTTTITYTATATFSGCTQTFTSTVAGSKPLIVTGVTAICNGDSALLTTTNPFANYSWNTSPVTTQVSANDSIHVPGGNYTVTVSDILGCTYTSPVVNVASFDFTILASGVQPYCVGDSILLSATNISNPVSSNAGYTWSTGSSVDSIFVHGPGSYQVTLSYTNGCTTDTTLVVSNPKPLPTPAITGTLFTCSNIPTTLTIDSASIYSNPIWSNSVAGNSISVVTGSYTVTVTGANGCKGTSPVKTIVNFSPLLSITGNQPFCPGDSIMLTAVPSIPSGTITYAWSTLATSSSIEVKNAGSYIATINYTNGCSARDTADVVLFNKPVAHYTVSPLNVSNSLTPVNFTDHSTVVTPATITNWFWDFGVNASSTSTLQNPTYTYELDGVYPVTLAVETANGCWDSITASYNIISDIKIPNVVTPNDGGTTGLNKLFYIKNLRYFPGTSLTVFNRWGKKVYESKDYQNDWDCDRHPSGVYYYVLSGSLLKETKNGFFEILR